MKEINLRMLIRLYNGSRYLPNILPKMDEISGSESNSFYITTTTATATKLLPDYDLHSSVLFENIELDDHFKADYRNWLEANVYSKEEDDEEEEELNSSSSNSSDENENKIATTPLPDIIPKPITADELTREINKLYLEELQREFEIKQEKQRQFELEKANQADSWDTPIVHSTNSWGNVTTFTDTNMTASTAAAATTTTINTGDDWDEERDEIEPEVDPLQGINWDSLTEEDLKKRLTLVEGKTVHRWLNIDMDDPAYIKVLNTFEGEILEDNEGWPI